MITIWIITIITFLIGFGIGYYIGTGRVTNDTIQNATSRFKGLLDDNKVGKVIRPTARDIMIRNNPKLKEEEDAMRDTLKDLGI